MIVHARVHAVAFGLHPEQVEVLDRLVVAFEVHSVLFPSLLCHAANSAVYPILLAAICRAGTVAVP